MKKVIITLFAAMILFSCSGQLNQSNTMNNAALPPNILFQKRDKLFLRKENDVKYYLTYVAIEKPENDYKIDSVEFSKVEFTLTYGIEAISRNSRLYESYSDYFVKDSDNINYKIFERSYLDNLFQRDNIFSRFKEVSFSSAPEGPSFIGYSDNETLLAVKVWNYTKKFFKYDK
jgi:hypothetical protein